MKFIKFVSIMGILLAAAGTAWCPSAMAANPGGDVPTIIGPEYWGSVVVDSSGSAYLKVKRIVDCDVEIKVIAGPWATTLPSSAGSSVGTIIPVAIFDDDPGDPIITKEKNWMKVTFGDTAVDVYFFDVQIKFKQP